jgi:hypothetical protein
VIDVGFPPPGPVDADFDLGRERALCDLAIDGGAGEAGADENGAQADDTVWLVHSRVASCWSLLIAPDSDRNRELLLCKRYLAGVVQWRRNGGK